MFVNKNLWRKYFQTFIVLLAMIISLLPISILETRVKAKTDDYTPDKVLTESMVDSMAGCEAEIKGNEIIIRPKNGASEGVISFDRKRDDFKALQDIFFGISTSNNKTLRFEGNIYGYGSLKELFRSSWISSLGNINKFNVSNVTDMSGMFGYCTKLTTFEGLKNWNVSKVTNMGSMFSNCANITSLEGLNNWNVSKVTNMGSMFRNCENITSLEGLNNWNVSNVTDMRGMFYECKNLNSIEALKDWNVSNVTNMSEMFYKCKNLNSIETLKNWNVSKVTNMMDMFYECTKLTSLEGLNNWNVSKVTNMGSMFAECRNITSIEALKDWNVSNVTDIHAMFRWCEKIISLEALKNWNVSNVTNMKSLFAGCANITSLEALKNWNVSKATNMESMFASCANITSLEALKNWNVSKATNMVSMFINCANITSLEALKNWNVSNVTDMGSMFNGCEKIISLDALKDWNVSNVTNMASMFSSCEKIISLEALKNWNVSKVTNMGSMFSNCANITSIEALKNWDVSKVTNMGFMFSSCHGLGKYNEVVDTLNAWNMSKVDNTERMFSDIGYGLSLDKHKLILDFSNASIKKLSYYTFDDLHGILILNNKNLEYKTSLLEKTFLTVTNNENYLNGYKNLKYYRDITLKYGNNKFKKISMPAIYDSKGSKDVYNIIKEEVDKKIKATINELKAENPSLFLTGEYTNILTSPVKTLALFGEYELKSQKEESETKVIKAKMKYEADETLEYNTKQKERDPEDGQKEVTTKKTLKDGNWVQEGEPKEKVIKPAKDGLTKVGNKEVSTNGDETITKIYEVNPDTGVLTNPKVVKKVVVRLETISAKMKYEADENLEYNTKQKVSDPENGQKRITIISTLTNDQLVEGKPTEEIIKPAKDGLTKVGNKEVITNGNETITKIYEVNPDTGALTNPKVVKKVVVRLETISAKMKYEADENLEYNTKQKVSDPENGQKRITIISTLTNDQLVEGKPTEEIVKPAKDGLTKVGNKKVVKNGDTTTIEKHEVDPNTGDLGKVISKEEIKLVTVKAKTKYEADESKPFGEKKVIKVAEDGQKEVTTKKALKDGNWVQEGEPKEKVIKPAKDGLTKVGNKEVSTNGNETITKIYEVNPDTGALTNPRTHISRPIGSLVGSIKEVVIKANMKYEADETLPFGEKKEMKATIDGKKKVQDTGKYVNGKWVKGTDIETIIKPAKDGLTKVGNKKVVKNGDTTTIEKHEVDPNTGDLGKVISKEEIKLVTIKANMKYEADDNLTFNEKKVIKVAEDGQKEVTTKKTLKDGNWVQEGEPKEKVIKPAKDGLTKVGNKKVVKNGDTTTIEIHEVDPNTGDLGKVISKEEIKLVTVKAKTKYEADDNLTFNEKKVIKVAEDGQKEVTTKKTLKDGNWVQEGEPKEKVIKPAKDGLTKVGNKEVSTNGNETITKIYEVNPDTGELSNPKVTKTVKMARLVPAQHHNHNNQQTMSHTVDTSDHSSLSYYGMFLSALSVLCLILLKKEKLN